MEFLYATVRILFITGLIALALYFGNRRLVAYYSSRRHLKFRQQLIQLGAVLAAVLLLILLMPIDEKLRGDLLGLYGLIISAIIALSSTTLVGNVMAGIMLKVIGACRPGDFITVGDYFGRISEMDLLHTEIQTEDRDLTTLPNMYLVTNPVRVMQASGSVLTVELSLGYDVSRHTVEKLLTQAAAETGLENPYVQITELGDFSVGYRVSGMLTEVNRLLEKRRELRARCMDSLHAAGIEIVSPNFMNTRAYDPSTSFVPVEQAHVVESPDTPAPDAIVFDKAEKAESVEKLRESLQEAEDELKAMADSKDADESASAVAEKEKLEARIQRLKTKIEKSEQKISAE